MTIGKTPMTIDTPNELVIDNDGENNFIVFKLNQQLLALSVDYVVQIIPMVTIDPLPEADNVIEGLINVRGESVVVVNLRRRLGLPEIELGLHTPILLARLGNYTMGLIVDEVVDVLSFSEDDIVPSDAILPEGLGKIAVLTGVIQKEIGTILLVNIDRLFMVEHKTTSGENGSTNVDTSEAKSSKNGAEIMDASEPISQIDKLKNVDEEAPLIAKDKVEVEVEAPVKKTNSQESPTQPDEETIKPKMQKKTKKKSVKGKKSTKNKKDNRK